MTEIYPHLPMPKRAIKYARMRIEDLGRTIEDLAHEKILWIGILNILRPCDNCGGDGEIRYSAEAHQPKYEKCRDCKGRGTSLLPGGDTTDYVSRLQGLADVVEELIAEDYPVKKLPDLVKRSEAAKQARAEMDGA